MIILQNTDRRYNLKQLVNEIRRCMINIENDRHTHHIPGIPVSKYFNEYEHCGVKMRPLFYEGYIVVVSKRDNIIIERVKNSPRLVDKCKRPLYVGSSDQYVVERVYDHIWRNFDKVTSDGFKWITVSGKRWFDYLIGDPISAGTNGAHMMRAVNTIIVDELGVFNTPNIKQLDYPQYEQYTLFSEGRLVRNLIHIDIYGITNHIYLRFIKMFGVDPELEKHLHYSVEYSAPTYCIRDPVPIHIATQKSIKNRIAGLREDASVPTERVKNPRCFITDVPLFGKAYLAVIKIGNVRKNVLLSAFIVHSGLRIGPYTRYVEFFISHMCNLCGFQADVSLRDYHLVKLRSVKEAIAMLSVEDLEKELLLAIHNNNVVESGKGRNRNYTTYSTELNRIYVGYRHLSYEAVREYSNVSSTVIFTFSRQF